MTPQATLDVKITRYRAISREARVALALRLHELARLEIRRQHPAASASEVEGLLRQQLELALGT